MKAKLKGDRVLAGKEAVAELYKTGYFGRQKGEGLELALVEAAYLLSREKLELEMDGKPLDFRAFFEQASLRQPNFELKYIVYKDLKERGYYVQPSAEDFRVYPRGSHPGKSAARIFVRVQSERHPLPVRLIQESVAAAENVHKELVLAVVDEESDITFYEVKTIAPKGGMPEPHPAVKTEATFLEDRVIAWEAPGSETLYSRGFYGKMLDSERLQLSLVESLYLLSEGVIKVRDRKGKEMSFEEFVEEASGLQSSFFQKYLAYKDLRDSGHVVKTGFKFGTHFRVYRKVESVEKIPHSEYLVNVTPSDFEFRLPVLSGAVRLANSVRKRMLFAVETEGKIEYLDIGRVKM
ncbi:tRNA-intron lyase [Methanosarcina sp. KYL-1]|uniref:tRNA-intron lyase n=1 Tax=Methanosarcina sp. KYL-1 TaxID=2602068 RepID=UPI0021009C86|nr:tRNA-intron lyase [Methanosarcina sp. KYL-1]MCQ1536711.1 tRNA-intron lyase [Methanosarcina sp. KYL-1]